MEKNEKSNRENWHSSIISGCN